MTAFQELGDISRSQAEMKKASINKTNIPIGVEGSMPTRENGTQLAVRAPAEKAAKWSGLIKNFLTADATERAWLDMLIGRLSFAQSAIFARFARSLLGPLYRKLKSMAYTAELPPGERIVLTAWRSFLGRPCAKLCKPFRSLPEFVLYTDASLKGDRGVLSAILFKTQGKNPLTSEFVFSNKAPSYLLDRFRKSSQIYVLELFSILAAIFQLKDIIRGKSVAIFCDNDAASQALVKGDSDFPLLPR